ncbi:hypothetical protein RIF29_33113 [Crotalaria pallida]|uniref:Uncharacterized protein n=1 Tax=Crotalaria pallida TaxID=3830 RepID=A0AAN9EDB5_CROPI
MAKKRGRPPKSPASQAKSKPASQVDLSLLDDEDIADIDSLSPKQAEALLKNIDVIHEKLKGKTPVSDDSNGSEATTQKDLTPPKQDNPTIEKRPSIVKEVNLMGCDTAAMTNNDASQDM